MCVLLVALACASSFPKKASIPFSEKDYGLPSLHKIRPYKFALPYDCTGGNYTTAALFLSSYSQSRASPDLLYRAWGGPVPRCLGGAYFSASTGGDDMSVIADLGVFPLANVSAHLAFNTANTVGQDDAFKADIPAVAGHTYSALLSKSDIRALFAFTVRSLNGQTGVLILDYAVLLYEVTNVVQASPGFSWTQGNSQ